MDVLFQQLKELQDEVHEIKVKPIYQSQRAKKQLPPTIKRRWPYLDRICYRCRFKRHFIKDCPRIIEKEQNQTIMVSNKQKDFQKDQL